MDTICIRKMTEPIRLSWESGRKQLQDMSSLRPLPAGDPAHSTETGGNFLRRIHIDPGKLSAVIVSCPGDGNHCTKCVATESYTVFNSILERETFSNGL